MPLASSHDQSVLNRSVRRPDARRRRRPLPVGKVQLTEDVADVILSRLLADEQAARELRVAQPVSSPERDRERDKDQEHANTPGESLPDLRADGLVEEEAAHRVYDLRCGLVVGEGELAHGRRTPGTALASGLMTSLRGGAGLLPYCGERRRDAFEGFSLGFYADYQLHEGREDHEARRGEVSDKEGSAVARAD